MVERSFEALAVFGNAAIRYERRAIKVTTSYLYHTMGLKNYEYRRTEKDRSRRNLAPLITLRCSPVR